MGWDGPMTARQFSAWQVWMAEEWNNPDRHDHYLMRVAQAQGDGKTDLDKYKIKWNRGEPDWPLTEREMKIEALKAKAAGLDRQGMLTPQRLAKIERLMAELEAGDAGSRD